MPEAWSGGIAIGRVSFLCSHLFVTWQQVTEFAWTEDCNYAKTVFALSSLWSAKAPLFPNGWTGRAKIPSVVWFRFFCLFFFSLFSAALLYCVWWKFGKVCWVFLQSISPFLIGIVVMSYARKQVLSNNGEELPVQFCLFWAHTGLTLMIIMTLDLV